MSVETGKRLVYLVLGSILACLGVALLYHGSFAKGMLAFFFLVWSILAVCLFLGQQWARWAAVVFLTYHGLPLTVIGLGMSLGLTVMMDKQVSLDWRPLLLLLVGLVFLVDAGILTFSEFVGDFFAERTSSPSDQDWTQATSAGSVARGIHGHKRDELLSSVSERKTMLRRGHRIEVVLVVLCWMIFLGTIGWVPFDMSMSLHQNLKPQDPGQAVMAAIIISGAALGLTFLMVVLLVFGYIALFVIPFVLTLPFVLPFARRWRDPVKFLVLRPLNKDRLTKALARFLYNDVAPFGHCYTRSDHEVRVPLHVRVPFLLGLFSFFNFRFRKVRQPQHIEKLVQEMREHVRRNLDWHFSGTKLFPISCCDPGWRACVVRLVQEVDIIVADLSGATADTVWELELLRDTGTLERTIFVAEVSQSAEAQKVIARLVDPSRTIPVLSYGQGVASNGRAAGTRIIDILCYAANPAEIPH